MGDPQPAGKAHFVDILAERRLSSDILWATRDWNAKSAYNLLEKYSPYEIKSLVLQSHRLQKILKKISQEKKVPEKELKRAVKDILVEIGYNRIVPILRWLGLFVAKILKKLLVSVYVNESRFLQIKSQMGNNPLLFVPSHKSYCDFILMSYLCFHYEVDIPRIAAGMDFQSMTLMGNVLRDVCAFFMRRSFSDDELYSAVFSQYVNTLVEYGDAAVEFFIEGTRSRTQKSLPPKYGFLSMTLKPFFVGLVPDITIVPVNLSYDRVLEEVLFAYELLGVPKPKESTRGFVKALSILNENYGNIYVQFGEPISVKKYSSSKIDRSVHGFGAVELQDVTPNELKCNVSLANLIVRKQKELSLLNCFNLIATVLNDNLFRQTEPSNFDNVLKEVQWLFEIFKILAPKAVITIDCITKELVLNHLDLHKSLIFLSSREKVQLCRIHSANFVPDPMKLKGHSLSNSTMDVAVPVLILQYYVNPCAHFLIGVCFIALIMQSLPQESWISTDELFKEFQFLCSIFLHEFVFHCDFIQEDFNEAVNQSKYFRIISESEIEKKLRRGSNNKLIEFCVNFLNSYIPGYITVMEVLIESTDAVLPGKQILKTCQQRLELKLTNGYTIHPANLSLDLLTNAVQSLVSMKAVFKEKTKNGLEYKANQQKLEKILLKLRKGIPDPWGSSNYVHHIYSYPIDSEKESRFWKTKTQNYVRDYLFKCPDKYTANSFRDNHNKSQIFQKSLEKSNCEQLFRNGKSEKNLQLKSQYPKKDPGGDHSSVNCSSDTDEGNVGKCVGFCQYCEKHIVCNCSASEARFECEDPGFNKFNNKKGKFLREETVCFCPYMTGCFARRNASDTKCQKLCFSKSKTPISKKIQTDSLIQCSKVVQTEKSKVKSQPKCTCFSKCLCGRQCLKKDCLQMNSCSNFCTCHNFKPSGFVCPYSVSNHCPAHAPCKYKIKSLLKLQKKKLLEEKERDESEVPKAQVEYFTLRNKIDEEKEEHEPVDSYNLKFGDKIFSIKSPSKTFDYLKDLSDYKLKSQLPQVGISPSILEQKLNSSSTFMDLYKRNPLFNLKQKGDFMETSKYPDYRYGFSESPFSKNKINLTQSNLYAMGIGKFNKFSEATIQSEKRSGNVLNVEKGVQNVMRSTESDNSGLVKNSKPMRIVGKHKKLRIKKKRKN